MLSLTAYAKINLTLEVLGKRPDGYHEVSTVLQTIDLADTISFRLSDGIQVHCNHQGLASTENTVVKAAELLKEATGSRHGASISITKGIPIAAGLGGSSSDAAATLLALNELWGLGLSLEGLLELASRIGSDVAFFLYGGTALAGGRGEKITPLAPFTESWIVLIKPPIDIPEKTKTLYQSLTPAHFTAGEATQRLVDHLYQRGEVVPSMFCNVFEKVAFDVFPGLGDYWAHFVEAGATSVHLAGAGPSLFTWVVDERQGRELCHRLSIGGLGVYLCHTVEAPRKGREDEQFFL